MNTFGELYSIIEKADVVTIWGHGLPDGDCYGSQIALREALRDHFPNKKVYAVGTGIPSLFEFISPMDEVDDETIASSLAVLVDVSCLHRVEDQRVRLAKGFIKFDHHNPNYLSEPFEHPQYADKNRIAAAEILFDFFIENNMSINRVCANALYTGLMTDSGDFIFYGTTPHTMEVAKKCIELGADRKTLKRIIYRETPEMKAFKRYMCEKTKQFGQVGYCWINKEEYESFGLAYEDASSYVNAIANAVPNNVYAYFCEAPNGEIRVELRSNKGFPVQPVAAYFGGGGHTFAAGLSIIDGKPTMEEVLEELDHVKGYDIDEVR